MDVKDRFKALPRFPRTKGTKFYKVRNYITWSVISAGILIGTAFHFTPATTRIINMVDEGYFEFFKLDEKTRIKLFYSSSGFAPRTQFSSLD